MKTALIHDWLVNYAGSERVLAELLYCHPDSDLYAVVDFREGDWPTALKEAKVHASFIQNLPWAKKNFRHYLPFMPLAVEQWDLSAYDLIISSSHAVAKGVITGPDQIHVSYIHSPMRYAWDLQHQYLREAQLTKGIRGSVVRYLLHRLRKWDAQSAQRVDHFVANSQFIARRIQKVYRREATVIYPPVDVEQFSLREDKDDFYLTASRLVPYKRVDLIVEAFAAMQERTLVVIGEGPEMTKIKQKATKNIHLLGYQSQEALKDHMQRARAFVFAAEEDFGITPVEAQACGTPVIAYGKGGALETIVGLGQKSPPTGTFFLEQNIAALQGAIRDFESQEEGFSPLACRAQAKKFAVKRFREEWNQYIKNLEKSPTSL